MIAKIEAENLEDSKELLYNYRSFSLLKPQRSFGYPIAA